MKKIAVMATALLLAGSMSAAAAVGFSGKKIQNSQIIQAVQNTTVNFAGSQIFVPQGQTIIIGQRDNGALVVRGRNLENVKIDNASISSQGNTVLSYYHTSNIAFLNRGESLTVTDAAGHTSTVAESGAISTTNAAINSDTVAEIKAQAEAEAIQAAQDLAEYLDEVPAFVAQTESSSAAVEQAVQNVEETENVLSPSAPR